MTTRTVEKGWGREVIWADEPEYCGKLLCFNKGARFSMHFHMQKKETWLVLAGLVQVSSIDTKTATEHSIILRQDDTWTNLPGQPHRILAITDATIIEVSTRDSVEDNYRIVPGDSQNANSN